MLAGGYRKKSPWGQWVQYNDKRGRGVFYYNVVRSQLIAVCGHDIFLDSEGCRDFLLWAVLVVSLLVSDAPRRC